MITLYFVLIFLMLILEAFFSGAETALVSVNRVRLRALAEKGVSSARNALSLLQNPHKLLATTLVGTNLSVVTKSVLATSLCIHFFGDKGPLIATIVLLPVILIFGEMLPKVIFRLYADRIMFVIVPILNFFQKILAPIIVFVEFLARYLVRLLGVKKVKKNPFLTKEDIRLLIQEVAKEGVLEEEEEETIGRIFKFKHVRVGDVMMTRNKIIGVDYTDTVEQIKEKGSKYGFTRYPVMEDKKILGVINIFDLFYNEVDNWHEFIRPVRYTYSNQRIDRLFAIMQPKKETMAVVMRRDKVIGIVTVKDIMREIVLPEEMEA